MVSSNEVELFNATNIMKLLGGEQHSPSAVAFCCGGLNTLAVSLN